MMLLQWNKYENVIRIFREIITEIFRISLLFYLLFYLIDDYSPGFTSHFFNNNILLWISIISGIVTVILQPNTPMQKEEYSEKISLKGYLFIASVAACAGLVIYFRTKEIGKLAYGIASVSTIIIFLLSILLWKDNSVSDDI